MGGLQAESNPNLTDLATDVTGIQDGQGFQDLPTGIGTVAGALVGGAGYLKAIGAATEGAVAANIFKDLTAKGLTNTAAQAGTKRFIAGTAANTIAGSPLSLAASMNDDGSIDPNALALNLTIDTAFGGAIEGAGALLTKNPIYSFQFVEAVLQWLLLLRVPRTLFPNKHRPQTVTLDQSFPHRR